MAKDNENSDLKVAKTSKLTYSKAPKNKIPSVVTISELPVELKFKHHAVFRTFVKNYRYINDLLALATIVWDDKYKTDDRLYSELRASIKEVSKVITEVNNSVAAEVERMEVFIGESGVSLEDLKHSTAFDYKTVVKTPQSREVITIFENADTLLSYYDIAALSSVSVSAAEVDKHKQRIANTARKLCKHIGQTLEPFSLKNTAKNKEEESQKNEEAQKAAS